MRKIFRFVMLAVIAYMATRPGYAQWVRTNGPFDVRIYSVAVSGSNLLAGVDGGVYLSTNNGASWNRVFAGYVDALVCTGGNLFAGAYEGIYLSTNSGASWTAVNNGLSNYVVLSLAVSGTNLFAGTGNGGVFLSTNNGTSWTAINKGLTNSVVWSLGVLGTNLFAGTEGGVFLSADSAASWTAVNSGLPKKTIDAFAIRGGNLFAGTWGGGVFLSTNDGTSWKAVSSGLTNGDVTAFAVTGTNIFAGTYGGGIFLSTNDGTNWSAVNTGLIVPYVYSLAVSDTVLFAGTVGAGVWQRSLSEMATPVNTSSGQPPNEFRLEQNYPNPFNPSTLISYRLPVVSHVTLKVFDVLGREVETLVNEGENSGSHSVAFDGTHLPSGVYFYRLSAGSLSGHAGIFSATKQLLLLK